MKIALAFLVLAAFLILGCGGGGSQSVPNGSDGTSSTDGSSGSSGGGSQTTDAFIGTWAGSWNDTNSVERHGTMAITIARTHSADDHVTVVGTFHDTVRGDGTVEGSFADAGGGVLTLVLSSGLGDPFPGAPTVDERGHLVGTLGGGSSDGGFNLALVMDLTRVP